MVDIAKFVDKTLQKYEDLERRTNDLSYNKKVDFIDALLMDIAKDEAERDAHSVVLPQKDEMIEGESYLDAMHRVTELWRVGRTKERKRIWICRIIYFLILGGILLLFSYIGMLQKIIYTIGIVVLCSLFYPKVGIGIWFCLRNYQTKIKDGIKYKRQNGGTKDELDKLTDYKETIYDIMLYSFECVVLWCVLFTFIVIVGTLLKYADTEKSDYYMEMVEDDL